jgi:hypothetical protein
LIGIALDFNRRGIKTATGGTWGTRSVKRLLTERRWAGLSEYKGELLLDKEGNPIRGQWEAIIRSEDGDDPLARHDNLRRILLHKSRTNGGSTARKYLLPGYVYCETCGKRLVSRSRGKTGHRSYQCAVQSPYNGCGKLSVIAGPLEDMVRDAVFEALEGPNLEEAIRAAVGDDEEQASAMASLREDRARLEELATDFYANGLLSRSEFLAARKVIEERIGQTERRLSRSARSKVLASLPGDGAALRAAWDAKGLDWKRSVVGTVLDRVVISPATIRGKNRFDPRRVQFVWKL